MVGCTQADALFGLRFALAREEVRGAKSWYLRLLKLHYETAFT